MLLLASSSAIAALLLAGSVSAHTRVWSVYINGVDQGTGIAIRDPLNEGPPANGYNNWPMMNLTSVDMACRVMGDIQDPKTLNVSPGDILTFDFHHNDRTSADDIIATSHVGPCMIWLSPDPPGPSTWVKIQEEGYTGFNTGNTWCTTGSLTTAAGKLNMQVPAGLAPGKYLIRPELIALHQGYTAWNTNQNYGAQFYFECIQLNVVGTGTVQLPSGVSFPGVYTWDDPGLLYNVYVSSLTYPIPGGTVWSGAAPSPSAPSFGTPVGALVPYTTWNTWINGYIVTSVITESVSGTLTTFTYTPTWSSTYKCPPGATCSATSTVSSSVHTPTPTPTPSPSPTPTPMPTSTTKKTSTTTTSTKSSASTPATTSAAAGTVAHYGQCGGSGWTGGTVCVAPYTCQASNAYYSQCL